MIGSLSSFTPLLTSLKSSTWLTLGSGIVTQKYACRLRATHTRPSTTPHLGTKGKTQHHNSSFTQFSFSRFPAAVGSGITTHQSSALQPILLRWRARVVFQSILLESFFTSIVQNICNASSKTSGKNKHPVDSRSLSRWTLDRAQSELRTKCLIGADSVLRVNKQARKWRTVDHHYVSTNPFFNQGSRRCLMRKHHPLGHLLIVTRHPH